MPDRWEELFANSTNYELEQAKQPNEFRDGQLGDLRDEVLRWHIEHRTSWKLGPEVSRLTEDRQHAVLQTLLDSQQYSGVAAILRSLEAVPGFVVEPLLEHGCSWSVAENSSKLTPFERDRALRLLLSDAEGAYEVVTNISQFAGSDISGVLPRLVELGWSALIAERAQHFSSVMDSTVLARTLTSLGGGACVLRNLDRFAGADMTAIASELAAKGHADECLAHSLVFQRLGLNQQELESIMVKDPFGRT